MALRSINRRDPRLQRALMRAEASPIGPTRGQLGSIYSKHAANELGEHLKFAELQERKDAFNARMRLALDKFKYSKKLHKQSMRDIERERKYTIGGGLLNLGVSGYLGKLQADKQREVDKAQTDAYSEMLKLYRRYNAQLFPQTMIMRSAKPTNPLLRRYFK